MMMENNITQDVWTIYSAFLTLNFKMLINKKQPLLRDIGL